MTWAMVAVAGAGVVGGMISSNAASDAASQQVGAANNATASQKAMFDKTVQLEQPYNNAGVGATQKLSYLLGISPNASAPQAAPAPQQQAQQPGQTTYTMPSSFPQQWKGMYGEDNSWQSAANLASASDPSWHPPTYYNPNYNPNDPSTYSGIPMSAFTRPGDAGVPQTSTGFAPQAQSMAAAPVGGDPSGGGGPGFGSLLKPFDMNDFQMDPGTQFRMKYGQQALQNSQAAQNGVMSGSALKDLIGFNQDYAGLGYQSAFDRYMANKSFTLGSLNDLANRGQAAAGNTVNSAGQFSSGIANTITGAGNAAAAGTVGSANALSGAVTGAGNSYMLSSLLNGGGNSAQGSFSQTGVGGSGFGTGLAYGNQDYGQYL